MMRFRLRRRPAGIRADGRHASLPELASGARRPQLVVAVHDGRRIHDDDDLRLRDDPRPVRH
eukprot:14123740-Heterocapsa_arctica.AAC.1